MLFILFHNVKITKEKTKKQKTKQRKWTVKVMFLMENF